MSSVSSAISNMSGRLKLGHFSVRIGERLPLHIVAREGAVDEVVATHFPLLAEIPSEASDPREFHFTYGRDKHTKMWEPKCATLEQLDELFVSNHEARDQKDGPCFQTGTLLDGKRNLKSVDEVHILVYDIDGAQALDDVRAILNKADVVAFVYTTYSHRSGRTEVLTEHYEKWADQTKEPETPTLTSMRKYLDAKGKVHLKNIRIDEFGRWERVADKGNVFAVAHDPVDKLRVVLPLNKPIVIADLGSTNAKATDAYKAIYHTVGQHFGFEFDHACSDPTRLFYLPSCPKNKIDIAFSRAYDGSLFDWDKVPRVTAQEQARGGNDNRATADAKPDVEAAKTAAPGGDFGNLPYWGILANGSFDVEELAENIGVVLAERSNGGHTITCPFESEHSDVGGAGTFCVNAKDAASGHWTIYCSHNSCKSAGRKRTDFVRQWLANGLITLDDLNTHSGVAVPPSKVTLDAVKVAIATLNNNSTPTERDAVCDLMSRLSASELTDARKLFKAQTNIGLRDIDAALKDANKRRAKAKAETRQETPRATPAGALSLRKRPYNVREYFKWKQAYTVADLADDVVNHLHAEKSDKTKSAQVELFSANGILCELVTDGDNAGVKPLETPTLVKHIGDVTDFFERNEDGDRVTIPVPQDVPSRILAVSDLPFSPLDRIAFAPFFTADGVLVSAHGYHPAAGVYYHGDLDVPRVPDVPTANDVAKAVGALHDVLQDFPMNDGDGTSVASRAHMLAHILQPCMRDLVDGPAPMFAIFKQLPGDGAGLFENVFSLINFGRLAAVSPVPKGTEGEWDKVLLTRAIEGAQHINFDNVPIGQRVDDGAFASALTAGYVEGRLLSLNKTAKAALRGVLSINGNKLQLSSELSRRCLPIRFDTGTPDPLHRAKPFVHPDLIGYVRQHRVELVWACLVIVQNWIIRGLPRWNGDPLPTFEEYSAVMGGILDTAGVTGFLGNRHLVRSQDQSEIALQAFAKLWHAKFGTEWTLVGESAKPFQGAVDLVSLYGQHSTAIDFWFNKKVERANWSGPLGAYLKSREGSTLDIGGIWVRIHKRRVAAGNQYRLEIVPKPAASGAGNANDDQDSRD